MPEPNTYALLGGLIVGLQVALLIGHSTKPPVPTALFPSLTPGETVVSAALSKHFPDVYNTVAKVRDNLRSSDVPHTRATKAAARVYARLWTTATGDPVGCLANVCTASNAAGTWRWRNGGAYVGDMLVVIGGSVYDVDKELIDLGYTVWVANERCDRSKVKHDWTCKENWGYLKYLSDTDPDKPVANSVAFIHGHNMSWHMQQTSMRDSLKIAMDCALKYPRYRSLHPLMYQPGMWLYNGWWNSFTHTWNAHFGDLRKIRHRRNVGWSAGQFVIPKRLISTNDSLWERAMQKSYASDNIHAIFWEYNWHVAFGEDTVSDVFRHPQECMPAPNDQLGDPEYAQLVRTSLRGTVVIDRYMQEIRTANSGTDVLVVFGLPLKPEGAERGTSPKLVAALQAKGYNVWLQHPESVRSTLPVDLPTLGYLTFLRREGRVATQRDVVFLRGDEDVAVLKDVEEGLRCAGEHKQYVALGRNTEEEVKARAQSIAAALKKDRLPVRDADVQQKMFWDMERHLSSTYVRAVEEAFSNKVKRERVWPYAPVGEQPLLPRIGQHFVVTQSMIDVIPTHYWDCVTDECISHTGRACMMLMEYLWHVQFGAPATLPSAFSDQLCQPYHPRPFAPRVSHR